MIESHLSYSRINQFVCPLKYYINYDLKISYMSKYLIIGSIIHKYYEEFIFFPENFTWLKDKSLAIEKIKNDCINMVKKKLQSKKTHLVTEENIDKYYFDRIALDIYNLFNPDYRYKIQKLYQDDLNDGKNINIIVEKEYNFNIENETKGRFKYFKFIPDIIIKILENKCYVIDIKTGGKYKSYDKQLNIYCNLVQKILNVNEIYGMFYYVKMNDFSILSRQEDYFNDLMNEINQFCDYFGLYKKEDYLVFIQDFCKNPTKIYSHIQKFPLAENMCQFCFIKEYCLPNSKIDIDNLKSQILKWKENFEPVYHLGS